MNTAPKTYLIRAAGIVPKNKQAAREALEHVPHDVHFIWHNEQGNAIVLEATAMEPGQRVPFTDGDGKYYGTAVRNRATEHLEIIVT